MHIKDILKINITLALPISELFGFNIIEYKPLLSFDTKTILRKTYEHIK
tara:strand:+ start:211 stop:357 length:147 start_codon:yes stop_codon:yes gene_type:complete